MATTSLAPEQIQWAEKHVGENSRIIVDGSVTEYEVLDNGLVKFTVVQPDGNTGTFYAWPPATAEQQAEIERQAEEARVAAAEAARKQAEEQEAAEAEQRARDAEALQEQVAAAMKEEEARLRGMVRQFVNEALDDVNRTRGPQKKQ